MELAPYQLGEPVYEVQKSPEFDPEATLDFGDTVYHSFYPADGFNFMMRKPKVSKSTSGNNSYMSALLDAMEAGGNGYYYCLIKGNLIISMQYIKDKSQVRFVD